MIKARVLIVLPLAILVAGFAVRAMVFQAPDDHPLHQLQTMFPGHPQALIDRAMGEIGAAAAKSKGMPPAARQQMMVAARKDPLAPTPFLVDGTIAQIEGDDRRAEALFVAARLRDPRAPAARYFLADRYLRTNRIAAGLVEMAALARISEKASQPLAPALAAYARSAGAIPQLRKFFAGAPATRDKTLEILSADPANANLVLALAPPLPLHQLPPPAWQVVLVRALVTGGNYAGAEDVWRRINGITHRGLLYDPDFRDRFTAPPFNWQLSSGSGGVAEASGGGGLDVVYYNREEISLATQLLRLGPGTYRLAMRVEAPVSANGLAWNIACDSGDHKPLLQLPLDAAHNGVVAGIFSIPADACAVQWIQLRGRPGDASDTAQATISALRLEPQVAGL